ncbi:hypothetical protein CEQ90_07085 [Lewinellaceae bacterium SD302]|nr:hypothetical protein CEQ90_07085 [Lewinellaceae bacterium SD302]
MSIAKVCFYVLFQQGEHYLCFVRIFLLLSILCCGQLAAQQDSLTTLAFGVGGGFFGSQIELTNTLRPEYTIQPVEGIHLGASVRYFNNRAVGFIGELNYTQAGWQEQISEDLPVYRRDIDFIDLQILTQVAIGRKLIRPMVQAGPYFSLPLSQSEIVPDTFAMLDEENYYGEELPFRPNYGLAISGGFYLQVGPIGIQLEGRGFLGVSDLVRSGSFGVTTSRRRGVGGKVTVFYEL